MLRALEDEKPPLLIPSRWYGHWGRGRPRAPRGWPRPELSHWVPERWGGGSQSQEEARLFMQIEPVALGEDQGGDQDRGSRNVGGAGNKEQ